MVCVTTHYDDFDLLQQPIIKVPLQLVVTLTIYKTPCTIVIQV